MCGQAHMQFFHTNKKNKYIKQKLYIFLLTPNSEERPRLTKSSLQVSLTISSLFTNLVPILRTMAVTHTHTQYVCSKFLIINWQKTMHMCNDAGAIANASRHGLHFIKCQVINLVQIYLVLIWHTCQIHISYMTCIFQLNLVQRLKKEPTLVGLNLARFTQITNAIYNGACNLTVTEHTFPQLINEQQFCPDFCVQ